ncbi:MAG: hypothetical protein J6P72_04535 [Firmicutes bacterium]|nr:hypothetical protein [Bacillota bacterium]
MNPQFSFKQYRAIDLTLFGVILGVLETLLVKAASYWFADQLYSVSIVGALTAIVLIRWEPFAAIHAALGGLVLCFASGAQPSQYAVYIIGNLFSMLMLIPLKLIGSEKIRQDAFKSVVFGIGTLLLMQLGRAAVAFVLGTPFQNLGGFFTTDALSLLFTGVVIWVARRMDGIFENQKHYLLRLHKSEEEKGGY